MNNIDIKSNKNNKLKIRRDYLAQAQIGANIAPCERLNVLSNIDVGARFTAA